jgi:predicted glycoside hydrolase/deacetylase ChbG (UPF0249 family)
MNFRILSTAFIISFFMLISCLEKKTADQNQEEVTKQPANWAERLGYPAGKKVVMLHADDAGMCEEANISTKKYFQDGHIQSASAMPPCPNFDEFIEWAKQNPQYDIGLHLTLLSEFDRYRWSSVLPVEQVPSLNDKDGKMWLINRDVVINATVEDIEKEVRAQIDKSIRMGYRPSHIDTHDGTLYAHPAYAKTFLKIAMEYGIPANVVDFADPQVMAYWKERGAPITDEYESIMDGYTLPKLDNMLSVDAADTYQEKIDAFKKLIRSLRPGLTEILSFHPAVESDNLKGITYAWQQRVWEAEMFADPDLIKFFEDEGLIFTNWTEIMKRFNKIES